MPYCKNCGAELREDVKYCPSCGISVGPVLERGRIRREERRPASRFAVFLIILVVSAVIIVTFASLPFRTFDVARSYTTPFVWEGLDTLKVDLSAEVAGVEVVFERQALMGEQLAVSIDVVATARAGIFGTPDFLNLVSQSAVDGNVLTVTSEIELAEPGWPPYSLTNVRCVIQIDPSLNTSLDLETATGGIVLHTQAGVALDSLNLEAITGGIDVDLVEDVSVSGDISLNTETGSIQFSWDNVIASRDVLVEATTTTGGVDIDVKQYERFPWNVTLNAEATTGRVGFSMDIQDDIGARIESRVTTGEIEIDRQVGFSLAFLAPDRAGLLSDNYPAGSNFGVSLKTTTGGIDIDATYIP